MPASGNVSNVIALVWGDEEFTVKKRAQQIFQQWCGEIGGCDHETIDACVSNSGEALRAIAKLRAGMQTLPFFGSGKVIWFKNCNFLGEERFATAQAVTETLTELAQEFKKYASQNIRILVSAGVVDRRRSFYKTLEKTAQVENYAQWSAEDRDWVNLAETWVQAELGRLRQKISAEALSEFLISVGPNLRQLNNELEKLSLYAGQRVEIEVGDVNAVVTRYKQARAFALADALGDRDLPRLLRALENELWELRLDGQKSAIGLLYGLISKVRVLIFLKEAIRVGWLKPNSDWHRFKTQLESLPNDLLPEDKRLNPLAMHPYVLFKALPQTSRFSLPELIRAMELLLNCNQRLIYANLDEGLVLQQTLVQILSSSSRTMDKSR